ncbi:MAG: hypothetical protein ABI759_14945 [Candidatus Solibacter sp.]
MRLTSIFALGPAIVLSLCAASDFWNTRAPGDWSAAEIKQMVTASPWAKPATVSVHDSPSRLPAILVRWDSATPVREACSAGGMEPYLFSCASKLLYLTGLGEKFDALRKSFYIVSVSGYPKPPRAEGDAPEHSEAGDAALAQLGGNIRETTFLKREGKPPIQAGQIIVLPAGDALLLLAFFPRAAELATGDGDVLFESVNGPLTLKATFPLGKMAFRELLDL